MVGHPWGPGSDACPWVTGGPFLSPVPSLHWRVEGKWAVTSDGGGEGHLIRQSLVPSMGLAITVGHETERPVRKGSWAMP